MAESPSQPLSDLLIQLGLCTPADLRRSRRFVRRLAVDLPAFDSVWLDALVQMRRLTPFQARVLESPFPTQAELGPCHLLDCLAEGVSATTYLGRRRGTQSLFALKLLRDPQSPERLHQWRTLIQPLAALASPSVCGPVACEHSSRGWVLISPFIDGPNLLELLTRRGRIPAYVVVEIAHCMLEGIHALEQFGLVHGDIRLTNARLTAAGRLTLVDAGIRPVVEPEQTIHARFPPEQFDGTAPELIGSRLPPTVSSDLYALGCLLWQLLAGRPPFPGGDPLIKLASHQSRAIPDVRQHAPDCPASVAELIAQLTRWDPKQRPTTAWEARQQWSAVSPRRSGTLVRFRREFDHPRRLPGRRRASPYLAWAFLAVAAWVSWMLIGIPEGAQNTDPMQTAETTAGPAVRREVFDPARDRLPVQTAGAGSSKVRTVSAESAASETHRRPKTLPTPDARGVVRLEAGEHYDSRSLTVVGPLEIRGSLEQPAHITVTAPWELVAESIKLEGVEIQQTFGVAPDETPRTAALVLRAQSVSARSITIFSSEGVSAPPSMRWELVDDRDTRPTTASFRNCLFFGDSTAFVVPQPVSLVQFTNCFLQHHEAVLELAGSARSGRNVRLRMEHVTCREVGGVVRWWGDEGPPAGVELVWEPLDSLFDLAHPTAGLCQLLAPSSATIRARRLRIQGEGSLIPEGGIVAAWHSDRAPDTAEIGSQQLLVEGLLATRFEFSEPATRDEGSARTTVLGGPRRTRGQPGFQPGSVGPNSQGGREPSGTPSLRSAD